MKIVFENYKTNKKNVDIKKLKECLRRLNEGGMSPEDEADSKILRKIVNKVTKDGPQFNWSSEEQEILDKYGLHPYYLTKETSSGQHRLGASNYKTYYVDNDKVNFADQARKLGTRPLVSNNYDPNTGDYDYRKENRTRQEDERGVQNARMRAKYNKLKHMLDDRKEYEFKKSEEDRLADERIAKIYAKRDKNKGKIQSKISDTQNNIDDFLKKQRSKRKQEFYLREDWNSDFVHDVYNALADVAFKYKKKGVELTSDDWDSAYEWFADRFFIVDFDEE